MLFFFFNGTAPTAIYTLSLHDALPISRSAPAAGRSRRGGRGLGPPAHLVRRADRRGPAGQRPPRRLHRHHRRTGRDRKSTRLNSSHVEISYAVFCLKKKKKTTNNQ